MPTEHSQYINFIGCIATAAFFAAFILTFWPGKIRLIIAASLYAVGIITYLSPYAYFHFIKGAQWTFGRFPTLEWLWPLLALCFAVASALLLWPFIPQKIAFSCGIALFFVIAPVLDVLRMLPYNLQFHHQMEPLDLTWLVYAILWFRIHEKYGKQGGSC